ncbi:putative importin subunit beta-4 [Termitomyces sp. J132]|nr:putative importin subunit beta-4 [Termitomyces sp. J132]
MQNLHNLLVQTVSPDTNSVKAATAQLNAEFYKTPACIPALANILASSPEQAVRQLAAVELRKRVAQNSGNLWITLPQNEREEIKSRLPELILAEVDNLVRHSAARVVAAIATIEIPLGTWGQLLPFLHQTCTSPQVSHREVGIYILFTVLENIVEGFQEHLQSFFKLFEQLLVDPVSIEVRITTVRALGVIAQYIDSDDKDDLKAFQALLPAMIQVIGQCVETGNENGARQLFDVLETLLILEVPILGRHIPELAHFLLQCGGNRNFEGELRVLALNALNWTVQYKKSKIQSNNLAPAILEGLMPIATEEEPEDLDDDAPSRRNCKHQNLNSLQSALRIIDGLSTNLPPSQVFPALRNLILQYFSSPDPQNRRGAMLALGVSVEGCSEYMTPLMNEVWPIIETGLVDGDTSVRKASCVAVSCLCEWLEDECAAKHAVLIPLNPYRSAEMNLLLVRPICYALSVDTPLTSCIVSVADASSAFASGSSPASAITAGDADTSVELEDVNLDKLMDVNSAIAVEKEIAADTIGTLFAACKAHFFPYVEQTFYDLSDPQEWKPGANVAVPLSSSVKELVGHVLIPLLEMYETEDNKKRISSAIGCLAEIIAGMKSAITPNTLPLLELFHRALGDPDAEVQSNAAFAVGQLVENTQDELAPQYLHILGALRPLFDVTPDSPAAKLNAKDNAAGAVGRLIVRNMSAVPLEQVLPIFIDALPLKNDYLENRPVFRAIFHLFQTNGAVLYPFLDRLLQVFAHVLDPSHADQIGDDIRADLIQLIVAINREDPAKVQASGLAIWLPGA